MQAIIILVFLIAVLGLATGHPLDDQDEGLKIALLPPAFEANPNALLTVEESQALYAGFEDTDDDLELAEVNVFRPVFRYRVAVAKKG